jgi:hypothetical protein
MNFLETHAHHIPRWYGTIACIVIGTAFLTVWQGKDASLAAAVPSHKQTKASTCEMVFMQGEGGLEATTHINDEQIYTGVASPVRFSSSFPEALTYRTRIREAVRSGTNFAGHYTLVTIGCGTNCARHTIVDTKTGQIIMSGLPSIMGIAYKKNSRLLIVNPKEGFPTPASLNITKEEAVREWSAISREYYVLEESEGGVRLQLICREHPFDGQFSS